MEGKEIANKHMNRCSTSLVISETQMKITMIHPFIPARIAKVKTVTNAGKDARQLEISSITGRNA